MHKELLVVEDQKAIQMLLSDIFTSLNYKVSQAATGADALDEIHNKRFDLIIMDYRLPVLNGKKVVEQLEEEGYDIPIIMISGMIEEPEIWARNHEIVAHVLEKPFDMKKITSLAHQLLA